MAVNKQSGAQQLPLGAECLSGKYPFCTINQRKRKHSVVFGKDILGKAKLSKSISSVSSYSICLAISRFVNVVLSLRVVALFGVL